MGSVTSTLWISRRMRGSRFAAGSDVRQHEVHRADPDLVDGAVDVRHAPRLEAVVLHVADDAHHRDPGGVGVLPIRTRSPTGSPVSQNRREVLASIRATAGLFRVVGLGEEAPAHEGGAHRLQVPGAHRDQLGPQVADDSTGRFSTASATLKVWPVRERRGDAASSMPGRAPTRRRLSRRTCSGPPGRRTGPRSGRWGRGATRRR